jgi:putative two-component system response regulator
MMETTVGRMVGGTSTVADAASSSEARFRHARILIVDDEKANIVLLRRLLETAGYASLVGTTDSRQALPLYQDFEPDLILLDLNMPGLDGFGVLEQLAPAISQGSYLPILVLTGNTTTAAKQRALALGAKDFLTKPFDNHEVLLRIHNLLEPRFMHLALQDQNQLLETRVRDRTRALEEAKLEVLERLARAAEFRDDATGQHTRRVAGTAALLAERVGVDRETVDLIARASPLHDVGKIAIPDRVLLKPGALSPAEFEVMKTHTTIGAELLSGGSSALMQMAEEIALYHHERWDGTGYPTGLSGDRIPLPARIVAIADVFDALTHPRPYRSAWPVAEVMAHITGQSGLLFDPHLVEAFSLLPEALPVHQAGPQE